MFKAQRRVGTPGVPRGGLFTREWVGPSVSRAGRYASVQGCSKGHREGCSRFLVAEEQRALEKEMRDVGKI